MYASRTREYIIIIRCPADLLSTLKERTSTAVKGAIHT